jgi:putative Mg2+ transporter-C (MgtC) family protein
MIPDYVIRLALAFALGLAIGIERQVRQRTAGLRTVTLVAVGACLFVTLGALAGNGAQGMTQIASYVVSGIGFLGGGVIMREQGSIQGINTAATLWCSAAVGVLCGTGHFGPAALGTGIVLIANTVLRDLSRYLNTTPVSTAEIAIDYTVRVVCRSEDEVHVRALLINSTYVIPLSFRSLKSADLADMPGALEVLAELHLHPKDQAKLEQLTSRISLEKGVSEVSWIASPLALASD